MHFSREAVAQALLLASGDLNAVSGGGQVANNLAPLIIKIPQSATNEVHRNRRGLVVGNGDQGLSWVAIDKLDAEDLRGREGRFGRHGELGQFSTLFGLLSSVLNNWSLRK